jgi:membrane-anchored glycerophosphoryl diester phosphodiesterase (GDPDase)
MTRIILKRRFDLYQVIPIFFYVALRIPFIPQRLVRVAEFCG